MILKNTPAYRIVSTILILTSLSSCGLLNPKNLARKGNEYAYPKASEDAKIVYQLQSNKPRTHFFIDGKEMGVSRNLKVYINNQAHTITAQAEGCIGKEEYVQPPYSSIAPLGFTYLMGECTGTASPFPSTHSQASSNVNIYIDKTPPSINIFNSYQLRDVSKKGGKSVIIKGQVTDNKEIKSVTLNKENISLDSKGYFSKSVSLALGKNNFSIVAVDTNKNKTKKNIQLMRASSIQSHTIAEEATNSTMPAVTDIDNTQFGQYFALIIGNNDYQFVPKLDTAVNDAQEVAYVLESLYDFNTTVLLDATRKDILDAINDFKMRLDPNDNFIIYYAGHGIKQGSAYWFPVDAKPDSTTEWIQAETITAELKQFNSQHILVISDSCYSGELSRDISRPNKRGSRNYYLKKLLSKKSRTLIASGGNEPVSDGGGGDHSVFTNAFIQALKNTQKVLFTGDELFNEHIKEIVGGQAEQTPKYSALRNSGHEDGAFIFIRAR